MARAVSDRRGKEGLSLPIPSPPERSHVAASPHVVAARSSLKGATAAMGLNPHRLGRAWLGMEPIGDPPTIDVVVAPVELEPAGHRLAAALFRRELFSMISAAARLSDNCLQRPSVLCPVASVVVELFRSLVAARGC